MTNPTEEGTPISLQIQRMFMNLSIRLDYVEKMVGVQPNPGPVNLAQPWPVCSNSPAVVEKTKGEAIARSRISVSDGHLIFSVPGHIECWINGCTLPP